MKLSVRDRIRVLDLIKARAAAGAFSPPVCRQLKDLGGLCEFKVSCAAGVSYRVVFGKEDAQRAIVIVTIFRKTANNNRKHLRLAGSRWGDHVWNRP